MWQYFFKKNPYTDFPIHEYVEDVQGWGAPHPVFPAIIQKVRPRVIVEVGTWKGCSALYMAQVLQEHTIDGHIICVDTFLGSIEHYLQEDFYAQMPIKNGRPDLYGQFMANVIHQKKEKWITPLPLDADNATKLLCARGVSAEVIYIDGAHDYATVSRDLENYWKVLAPCGVLIGDDYGWDSVRHAADEFAKRMGIAIKVFEGKYLLEKMKVRSVSPQPLGGIDRGQKVIPFVPATLEVILRTHSVGTIHSGTSRVTDTRGGKRELLRRSLLSLIRSLEKLAKAKVLDIELTIVDDHSDEDSVIDILNLLVSCSFETQFIPLEETGGANALLSAFETGRHSLADLLYFAEDDYLYEPSAFIEMVQAYTDFSRNMGRGDIGMYLVDDTHYYNQGSILPTRVVLGANRHWRTVERTAGSFMIPRVVLQSARNDLWHTDVTMWSPIPTLAYHMNDEDEMQAFSNWRVLWDQLGGTAFVRMQQAFEAGQFSDTLVIIGEMEEKGEVTPKILVYKAKTLYCLSRAPEAVIIMRTLCEADPGNDNYKVLLAQYMRA
ncbi:MAG: CmcI family methyltransferase [bacterium]|nr:CmcI family methyltransferase [bacterium]